MTLRYRCKSQQCSCQLWFNQSKESLTSHSLKEQLNNLFWKRKNSEDSHICLASSTKKHLTAQTTQSSRNSTREIPYLIQVAKVNQMHHNYLFSALSETNSKAAENRFLKINSSQRSQISQAGCRRLSLNLSHYLVQSHLWKNSHKSKWMIL